MQQQGRVWSPPTEEDRERGPRVDRQQLANNLKLAAAGAYKSRTRYNTSSAFAGMKRAVDEALTGLRQQEGMGGVADRLLVRIAHHYDQNHRHGTGMKALEAFSKAVDDALDEWVETG